MRNTGADERANFEARLGLGGPRETCCRAAERRQRSRDLGVALHEAAVVVGPAREVSHLGARRRRRPPDDGLHLVRVHRHALFREAVAEEAELLPPEFALGALGEQLPAAEDLEHLRDVEQAAPAWASGSGSRPYTHRPSGPDASGTPPWIGARSGWGRQPAAVAGPEGMAAAAAVAGFGVWSPGKSRPTVSAWFMTRISSEEAPCRPEGTTHHSNWPSGERKLSLQLRTEARLPPVRGPHPQLVITTREIELGQEARPPRAAARRCAEAVRPPGA